ncbi:MAG TPA: ANTAR domain-containing protein [Microlunatus sp.]|nr:ANTAR domain-containing protein [Microlunatus sp.]
MSTPRPINNARFQLDHTSREGQRHSHFPSEQADTLNTTELVEELTHLRAKLDSLPTIERSKGILMRHYRIEADTAFDVLRRWSSSNNLKLRHISRLIVDAATRDARSQTPGAPPTIGPSLTEVIAWLNDGAITGHIPSSHCVTRSTEPWPGAATSAASSR